MEQLTNELKSKIKELSFEELEELLIKYDDIDITDIILDEMKERDFEKYMQILEA